MNKRLIRKLYTLLAFVLCIIFLVGCSPLFGSELVRTDQFTDEITGRTFEREEWHEIMAPWAVETRFYEIVDGYPARRRIEPLSYESIPDNAYGGIRLYVLVHATRPYNIALYEPVPFFLNLDEVRVDFTKVSAGSDVTFSFLNNEQFFYFSGLTSASWGSIIRVRTDSFELDVNEEQLQDILESLEQAEQVLRTDRFTLATGEYYWRIDIVSNYHTTFFYINGEATYHLLRTLIHHPVYQADPAEVIRLQEIFDESRLSIQEAIIARSTAWNETFASLDSDAEPDAVDAVRAERHSIGEYYDARIQAYFEEGLQRLTAAYEDSSSNISFEYLGFKMTLIAIFERGR